MRTTVGAFAFILATMLSSAVQAQVDDGFDAFWDEANADFDTFLEEEDKAFSDFLRDPWKEFESEKPDELPPRPEPPVPEHYDAKAHPADEQPTTIVIGEIFKLNRVSDGGNPVIKVADVDEMDFGTAPRRKQGGSKTVVRDTVVIAFDTSPRQMPARPAGDVRHEQPQPPAQDQGRQPADEAPVQEQEPVPDEPSTPQPVTLPPVPPAQSALSPDIPSALLASGSGKVRVSFGGCDLWLTDVTGGTFRMAGTNESAVADAYDALAGTPYRTLLGECDKVRRAMRLNGWGYNRLIEAVAASLATGADERTMLRFFLLKESGSDVRICRKASTGRLMLMVATDCGLFGYPYAEIGGRRYYNVTDRDVSPFYTCETVPGEARPVAMGLSAAPLFAGGGITSVHTSKRSPLTASVTVPEGLAAFYKDYPQCDYAVYLGATVAPGVRQALLASLRPYVEGKGQAEAANLLIGFVQTAFDYKTDGDQFGIEKPFFVEEMFCYPYSDCEDRAILYSFLVRELLGLDVVLLNYPEHMATAVAFDEAVSGDNLSIGGRRFTVCDPTYIGAPIGKAMPQFRGVKADVIVVD